LPLGKYVDIDNSLWIKRLKRERVEYRTALKNVKLKSARVEVYSIFHPKIRGSQ